MAFLRLQKRLAAAVLKCGQRRIWIDPNETNEVALANSRKAPILINRQKHQKTVQRWSHHEETSSYALSLQTQTICCCKKEGYKSSS
jgi:ribosomal protein L19E